MPHNRARSPIPINARRARGARIASDALECFAVAAPGLEPLVFGELASLGIAPHTAEGGAAFTGSLESVARANLWLRTASRILVRVASFRARAFHELEQLARVVPWERYIAPGAPVRFRVTSRKSRLYHTAAIAERLAGAMAQRLGAASRVLDTGDVEESEGANVQLFVIRVTHDMFTLSADSSGAHLHLRGYRQALAKAPARETLAAAMLIASGWVATDPLLDPMCGSGTIAIEGAMIARGIAPGRHRRFSFLDWPGVESGLWARIREEADGAILSDVAAPIRAFDRDAGAIVAARANAERAGVGANIEFAVRAISATTAPEGGAGRRGLVATNPPYGVRVGEAERLRDLYARFGQVLRARLAGWRLALLSANPRLDAQLRLSLEERLRTRNGGIPVRLLVGEIPTGNALPA